MKKPLMILMLTGLLWACNSNASPDRETVVESNDHAHETILALNNGQKWEADTPTNENVEAIRSIAQSFAVKPHTAITDYHVLGSGLQKGLNKMIQECKMSGPDHDALHQWFEPILKDVNELKKVEAIASAEKIFHAINERLDLYTQYFE
ncbi:hypothetical protein [Agriterribacter sp.]|uniref:hypothetical protein n=1 Tax=Agriterribacter sp. TaxID=2821509 RepID=UPI002CF9E38A|nr:hypothetical protein [Agriterribacter sp.]HRO46434.1 hypothetical protein [Agriterribacter sp.]HRQ17333.1 hypothetical protein [Agriterribacter sp.]